MAPPLDVPRGKSFAKVNGDIWRLCACQQCGSVCMKSFLREQKKTHTSKHNLLNECTTTTTTLSAACIFLCLFESLCVLVIEYRITALPPWSTIEFNLK